MTMEPKSSQRAAELALRIVAGVEQNDQPAVESALTQITMLVLETGAVPQELSDGILAGLKLPQIAGAKLAVYLLKVFEDNSHELSESQVQEVLRCLELRYEDLEETACFLGAELLADLGPEKERLGRLRSLSRVRNDTARALIAHGLERLCRTSQVDALAREIRHDLDAMLHDRSEVVRDEAKRALSRCSRGAG